MCSYGSVHHELSDILEGRLSPLKSLYPISQDLVHLIYHRESSAPKKYFRQNVASFTGFAWQGFGLQGWPAEKKPGVAPMPYRAWAS